MNKPELYSVSSGMGGSFIVRIEQKIAKGWVRCKVHMPRNPDWHGYVIETSLSNLTPVSKKMLRRKDDK